MVEKHGSQCGFCTPGIIMSLFGLYKNSQKPDREEVLQALAGNLCRCTGYRPIIEAALQLSESGEQDWFDLHENDTIKNLQEIAVRDSLVLQKDGKCFFVPQTMTELAELKKEHPGAFLLAGGTDLGLLVTKAYRSLPVIISLLGIPELRKLEKTADFVNIGAAISYEEALPLLQEEFPSFAEMLIRVGSRQIRNKGTLAGNIANASPIGDCAPALLAMGSTICLASTAGQREMPLKDFFKAYRQTALAPEEFITSIRIPRLKSGEFFRNYKISKRFDQDISTVSAAFCLVLKDGVVEKLSCGFGGMAATPLAFSESCAKLVAQPWTEGNVQKAAMALRQEFSPLTDFRAAAEYRRTVAGNLLLKFFYESVGVENEWTEVFSHE
jgi:xanthine dehydrogenase small subunit